ncbi:MAG: hypothetical protein IMY69_03795 [Bacteroidetes bacterium]|nr:hypothetical protein [Bacteroidota bacterium]
MNFWFWFKPKKQLKKSLYKYLCLGCPNAENRKQNKFELVHGVGSIDDIFNEICEVIDS